MLLPASILAAVAVTSLLSGILGMGGGIILMGLLTLLMPVADAMVLHGTAQLAANGARAALLWREIQFRVLAPYLAGAAVSIGVFTFVHATPPKAAVYVALGLMPFVARLLPKTRSLDVTRPAHATACGFVVMGLQLLAGASGPALDVFFLNGKLGRHAVVATKAMTQAVSHALKLIAYAPLAAPLGNGAAAPLPLLLAAAGVAACGTFFGRTILDRLSDETFRRASSALVLAVGAVYLASGVWLMLQPALGSP